MLLLAADPEPVFMRDASGLRPALLLRHDPETIQIWPGDERVQSAREFLWHHGWHKLADTGSRNALNLYAWGLMIATGTDGGPILRALRRPGGVIWEGAVPLADGWLTPNLARPGRLVPVFAVPDSETAATPGPLAERVDKAVRDQQLLAARIPLKSAT
ncbi:hypothetical protein Afil01_32980 [Actinorhabdospora filicis]|uniref:Uncharacterized protein n=1 Tax=Actinorhabdospora filicis TaxID=1785913 RepID=A0A9W6SPR5_9ACTN|nr:hypothetical protein [Actinorhabdospora filicis]GLZ78491.1 hypothetical protein Afil01_32980 [Actinorhabdospora filicis]